MNNEPHLFHIVTYTKGENWDEDKPYQDQEHIKEHIRFMAGYLDSGKLLLDGPFLNLAGGLAVFSIPKTEIAYEIAEKDPLVQSNILHMDVKRWLSPFYYPDLNPEFKLEKMKVMHVIYHKPGPAWVETLPFEKQPMIDKHLQYYSIIYRNKRILLGGPYIGQPGGMIILLTDNPHEAHSIALNDPAMKKKVIQGSIFPWVTPLKWR